MLVRHFVGKKLAEYYSQPASKVVGSMPTIKLSSLLGKWHWLYVYGRMYKKQGQWLTPVELFRPHYSNILANFVAESTKSRSEDSEPVHIVELGGGRATNASCILSHLQLEQPYLYDRVSYTILDSSGPLLELQKNVLSAGEHEGKVNFVRQDLMKVAEEKYVKAVMFNVVISFSPTLKLTHYPPNTIEPLYWYRRMK
jgi:hypothetical protein